MKFEFGPYILDVDTRKNTAIYKDLPLLTCGCDCQGCRNYVEAVKTLPNEIMRFFNAFGVDAQKPSEAFVIPDGSADSIQYQGWYPICGTILQSPHDADVPKLYSVTDHFRVWFHNRADLLPEVFTAPVFQMEIDARIPWMLDEPYFYL